MEQMAIDLDGPSTQYQEFLADLQTNPPPYSMRSRKAKPCRCDNPRLIEKNFGRPMNWCEGCGRFHSWVS